MGSYFPLLATVTLVVIAYTYYSFNVTESFDVEIHRLEKPMELEGLPGEKKNLGPQSVLEHES